MAQKVELVIGAKNETGAAFTRLNSDLTSTADRTQKLGLGFTHSTERAAKFADGVGRVSTTLARSADAFGLPIGALRTLDDMSDVAELGLNNLSKSAAGFNAASLGAAGAGLAVGTAIGSWLNTFPAVQKAADSLIHTIYRLGQSQEDLDKQAGAMQGLKTFQEQMGAKNLEAMAKQIAHLKATGSSIKEIAAQYKGLNPALLEHFGLTERQIKKQDEANKQHKEAAKAVREHETELRKLNFQLLGMENDLDAATLSLERHLSTFVDVSNVVPITTDAIEDFNAVLGQGPEMDPEVILGPIRGAKAELDRMAPTFGNALRDGFGVGLEGLGGVILGAIQGGGDVAASVGAKIFGDVGAKLGEHLGKAIGGTLGSTIGSFFGPIGTLIGGWLGNLAGKVGDFFGNLFGGKSDVSKARDQFFGQWEDGFIGVQRALLGTIGEVGQQDFVKMLFDAKSMEELNRVIALIKETIASVGRDVPTVHIPVTYDDPGAPGGGGEPEMARGGVVLPFVPRAARGLYAPARPGGMLARLGEGGEAELVAPVRAILDNAVRAAVAATGGRGQGEAAIIIDGQVLGRWIQRQNKAGLLPVVVR